MNTTLASVRIVRTQQPGRWRLHTLLAAPHRLAFAAGALMIGLTALWWALVLLAQAQGHAPALALPPYPAHGLLMVLGFMPLFFTGFLFTAGPRWLGRPPVQAAALLPSVAAQLSGWAVFLIGLHAPQATLAGHAPDAAFGAVLGGFGLAAVAAGWTQAWRRFVDMVRASRVADRTHARLIVAAGAAGVLCLWLAAAGVAMADANLVRAAVQGALWLFVGLTFIAVLHRMIPFFGAAAWPALDAWRPLWLLQALAGLLIVEGTLAVAEAWRGGLPPALQGVRAAGELAAGFGLLLLALRWGLLQSLRVRLLAMLHLGLVWLGVAFVLSGASHLLGASTGGSVNLGAAPLHVYTMGFLGSTLMAMVTRVSAGHGGRTVAADDVAWRLYWVLQLAVLLRVAGALSEGASASGALMLIAAAALVWAGACGAWALRHARWYGRARIDGRAG